MNHLKNNKLLLFILSLLMFITGISETGQFLVSLLLFTVTVSLGWLYSLPMIKSRFDDMVASQVNRIIPVVASLFLALSYWLTADIHIALFSSFSILWVIGVLIFSDLNLEKTAVAVTAPILSLLILSVLQPANLLGLNHPLIFTFAILLMLVFLVGSFKFILPMKVTEKKSTAPLPASLAKQVKKAEDAKKEINELKDQIKTLQVDLSAAEMAKMEFLATMSHEIRTPLNGIVPLIDIVMDTELNDFQRDYLNTAHTSATQMQKLIDDLLDYSKVEAGKLTVEITGIKLKKVVDEVVDNLKPSADRKGLEIQVSFDDQINPLLRGDPIRIRQVLTNILSNAIKFSDHGRIIIEVKKVKNFATNELIRFSIKDQGIGITSDQTEKLFNAFTQADNSSTRKFGGTGLGLAISKKIVELLKGQIGVESKKGIGSTFWFEIPFTKSAGGALHGEKEIHQHQAVLINSNPPLFKQIQKKLEKANLPVQTSLNYQHAISRIQAARGIQDGKTTLLFIDFDTNAKTLRQLLLLVEKGELDDVWICAITKGEHIAGIKQYNNIQIINSDKEIELIVGEFERRFTPEQVIELDEQQEEDQDFETTSKDKSSPEETTTEDKASKQKPKANVDINNISETILLVEDNEVNLKVAQKLIDYIGFPFDVAENGMIALNKAKKTRYRLILMDCQMPVMDGYFCTKRIRKYEENHQLNHTPIIAMTANAMLGDKEKCLDAGMDDYMSKPLNRYVLEKTLNKWDPFASQKKPPNENSNVQKVDLKYATSINPKWLNVKALAEIRTFMGEEINSLLDLFQQESPEMLEQLKTFSQTHDFSSAKQIAHTLKSTGANIGATGFSHFCKKIEVAAIENNLQEVMQNIEKARKAYVLTCNEIIKYKEQK